MTQKHQLLIIPFDDILEEIQPLDSLFWFSEYSFKDTIVQLLINATAESFKTFNDLDLENLAVDLYGQSITELIISEYQEGMELLDRCNAASDIINEEEDLIRLIIGQLVCLVENRLKTILSDLLVSDVNTNFIPFWNATRLVLKIKT